MSEEITDLYGEVDQEAMYQAAIHQPLEYKIKQAIGLIRLYENQALQLSEDGYYVCFSGGKDSIVMAKLFEMAGVKYGLHYNNVTIDPPELVRFIKREYPEVVWHSVGKPLPYMMENKSPPTRLRRWCCEIYKEPGGAGCLKATGVRAEESTRRKGLWKQVNADKKSRGIILCPILYWTDADVWEFIRQNNMKYCSLYDEGHSRLGCVGCPMAWKKKRAAEFARWPGYERLWKRGFQKYWDKFHGTKRKDGKDREWLNKFNSVDELWRWWMEDSSVNDTDAPDCQLWLW